MNWKNLIASFWLTICYALIPGCSEGQPGAAADTSAPEDTQDTEATAAAETPEPSGGPGGRRACIAKLTMIGAPVFVDRDFSYREPPLVPPSAHLTMGQIMHVVGPTADTYVLTPVESMPEHQWPTGVDHIATLSSLPNEYCVSTIINGSGHTDAEHQFIFRVLSNDPPEFCIQRPKPENECRSPFNNEHVFGPLHGGSANLF